MATFDSIVGVYVDENQRGTIIFSMFQESLQGAQLVSDRVLDSRPRGRGFEPHRRHCVVVLEQDTFILA